MGDFSKISYSFFLILTYYIRDSVGHGMLMDPVNRGSAWRKGFDTPINYNDNQNYCGGYNVQHLQNKGNCGICGDDYSLNRPRPSEDGGVYGTGMIVKTFTESQEFVASVTITAHHRGYFQFSLCPLDGPNNFETEECFERHPILTVNGKDKYSIGNPSLGSIEYDIKLALPKNVTCNHCSLRWHWRTGNNWGTCEDGSVAIGCGPQETFRTCSDIKIIKQ